MVTVTGPAIVIVAVIGYFGIHSIISWISNQINGEDDKKDKK